MIVIPYKNKSNGEEQRYRVQSYDELTIADYKRITDIPWNNIVEDWDIEHRIDTIAAYCGIPVDVINKRPMSEVLDVYKFVREQIALAMRGSDAFNAAIKDNVEYTPPAEVEIGLKTYTVPHDLEMDTIAAQWADWQAWQVPEQEADLIAEACAFMLVEVGQEYSGTPKDKIAEMMRLNLCEAFDLCAFFFAKSERFRSVTDHRRIAYLTLIQQRVEAALRLSTKGIEDSTFFSAPPNLNLSSGPSSETSIPSDPA